jgi:uncharacterized protein YajQ (UPF0234 family)
MPSFDIVSEIDLHEVANAVDQANREVGNRFDFKGTDSRYEHKDGVITLHTESDFQIQQMRDVLVNKLVKRGVDTACMTSDNIEAAGRQVRQTITLRQGIDTELAKKIVRLLKDSKLKVQGSIQGDKVRVNGKKRDDLQQSIALLREAELDMPLQFENFRD